MKKKPEEKDPLTECIIAWIKPKIEKENKKQGVKDYELVDER